MRVALIARSTLITAPGGDTVQVTNIAKYLTSQGVAASIRLTHEPINYDQYDLFHFFNITRPADIIYHVRKAGKPYVASTNVVVYSEYDKKYRNGLTGMIFRFLPPDSIEYLKTIARWINGTDRLTSLSYLWRGQKKSIQQVLSNATLVLPNSALENNVMRKLYGVSTSYDVIPNGVDTNVFQYDNTSKKEDNLILCVARIEGIKNQLNLIKALNNTRFTLLIIGSCAANQKAYYKMCRKLSAPNICFIDRITQQELVHYYQKAKVHILPSWFETCGLSTLEAAVMGCNVIVTDKGYTLEYFEDYALYCDPGSPASILEAVQQASVKKQDDSLRNKILSNYTWQLAASRTARAYQKTMQKQWE